MAGQADKVVNNDSNVDSVLPTDDTPTLRVCEVPAADHVEVPCDHQDDDDDECSSDSSTYSSSSYFSDCSEEGYDSSDDSDNDASDDDDDDGEEDKCLDAEAIARMLNAVRINHHSAGKRRASFVPTSASSLPPVETAPLPGMRRGSSLGMWRDSMPDFHTMQDLQQTMDKSGSPSGGGPLEGQKNPHGQSNADWRTTEEIVAPKRKEEEEEEDPKELLQSILSKAGYPTDFIAASSVPTNFFVPISDERTQSYSTEIVSAVRRGDVDRLRTMHQSSSSSSGGHDSLRSCNKFGESILHMACRRKLTSVVTFLVTEAQINVRVRDDYGRTPMHDAAWTAGWPDMDLIQSILTQCPDLLYICDERGSTPLCYARKEHWGIWCKFLRDNGAELLPREVVQPTLHTGMDGGDGNVGRKV